MSKGVFVTNEQVRLTGSPNVARFLAQCLYWSERKCVTEREGDRRDWFYKSREEWQEETWLSRYQQEKARKQLREMGLLEEDPERMNVGIKIWYRFNKARYYAMLNISSQTLDDSARLTLSYDNEHWQFAARGIMSRVDELYPYASVETVLDAIDGHLEYWMNRCKGKAGPSLNRLRGKFLTREREFLEFLNKVGQRDRAEDVSVEQHDSTLTERSETKVTDYSYNYEVLTDSKYEYTYKTMVLNTGLKEFFKPENSTIVLDNISIKESKCSDNHCVDNNDIEAVEIEESVEADASPLSGDLTDCSASDAFRADPQTYVFCHPFIYQFVQHCSVRNKESLLELLRAYGFGHYDVQQALCDFVECYGHGLRLYWKDSPVPVEPLTRDDIDDAILASGRVCDAV